MFAYSPIDRNALIRKDPSRVNEFFQGPKSRTLIWHEEKLITRNDWSLYFQFEELKDIQELLSEPTYLGRYEKHHYFACQLNQRHAEFDDLERVSLRHACRFISDYHLELLFYSQGVLNWHRRHSFCSHCGSRTQIIESGHARHCSNLECAKNYYPKIDPAVIFSIVNNTGAESKILLGRQSTWDENRYSVIAGFVEPGETLENAVRREAYEETGLKVDDVSYVSSQPWPFPDSLMVGFHCETRQQKITLIDKELEKADWFSADDIETKIKSGELKMPFSISISWRLIDRWFEQHKGFSLSRCDRI